MKKKQEMGRQTAEVEQQRKRADNAERALKRLKSSDDGYDGGKGSETGYYDGGKGKGSDDGYYDGGKGIDKSDAPRPRGGKHIRLAKALAIKEIEAGFADYTDEQMRYVNWSKRVQKHVWDEAQRAWQAQ